MEDKKVIVKCVSEILMLDLEQKPSISNHDYEINGDTTVTNNYFSKDSASICELDFSRYKNT